MVVAAVPVIALDRDERRAMLERLLADHPTCAVGVVDPARRIEDIGPVLADLGIAVGAHSSLEGGALAEFLAVSDVGLLGGASREATDRGAATRAIHMRDGHPADLHLITVSDTPSITVAVFVPGGDAVVASTPLASAVAASPRVGVVVCDAYGVIINASASTLALLGEPDVQIVGRSVVELVHSDHQEMAIVNWLAAKEQRGDALRWRCRLNRADGGLLWIEVTIKNESESDSPGRVELELYDISAEVAATEALVAGRELLELLTETLPVGVAKFDTYGRVEHANGRLRELLTPLDPDRFFERAVRGDLGDPDLATAFAALVHGGSSSRFVVDHRVDDATIRHLEWTIRAALGHAGEVIGGVVCVADVTESAQLRDALELRARTDALTGCLNRAGTIVALEHALAGIHSDEGVGLLFIDLDNFKDINDSRGHAVGDAVLEVVASRLRGASRPSDVIGRFGGDEFVIISPGSPSVRATEDFAERVSVQLHGIAAISGSPVAIAASIGAAWTAAGTASELIGAADAAMYIAKAGQCHGGDREPDALTARNLTDLKTHRRSRVARKARTSAPLPSVDVGRSRQQTARNGHLR